MAAKKEQPIIIKKVKKGGHGGAHGGSWKVAYADFVTAMMAFFLLLWLLAMVSPEKRIVLSEYFKEFNIFEDAGTAVVPSAMSIMRKSGGIQKSRKQDVTKSDSAGKTQETTVQEMQAKLSIAIDKKFEKLKDQIMLDITESGMRIQIVDRDGSPIFMPGKADLTPKAKEILDMIAENIKETTNRIAVEGHTDATPFSISGISNWEMSTMRASSARKELEADGIDPYRIARVVGYADTEPFIKNNPRDARNRRISLILLYEKQKEQTGNVSRTPELGTTGEATPK